MSIKRKISKILVTGGSGFIGSNFVHNFINNNPKSFVINIDSLSYAGNEGNNKNLSKENYKFFHGDICSKSNISKILQENRLDAVINFAAESHVDRSIKKPNSFIQSNIFGTYNLLECIREFNEKLDRNIHFHHISTDEVYGSLDKNGAPFSEQNKYFPNSPYSASKASSDHLVRSWHKTFNLPVTISNCSNNYGPFQFPEKLIPLTIFNILNGKEIRLYGDGMNIRDWLYVVDHCDAIEKILVYGENGHTYNVGGNNEISNVDIVNKVCNEIEIILPAEKNKKSKYNSYQDSVKFVEDRPGHDFRYSIDSSKILKDLNWLPKESFKSGIKKTVQWYTKNNEWLESRSLKNV
tara:strand:- start:672 stop:1727 length:1056 start_codon:yes stop_codon:yes gene_type:complete